MDTSIYLAKIIGLYFLIVGIAILLKTKSFKVIIHDVVDSPPLMFVSGIITLIVGILLVVSYNEWQLNWFLLITLVGWFALINGIIRIFFPDVAVKMIKKITHHDTSYYTVGLIVMILGIILSYVGFMIV